jgi:hypothetical protein
MLAAMHLNRHFFTNSDCSTLFLRLPNRGITVSALGMRKKCFLQVRTGKWVGGLMSSFARLALVCADHLDLHGLRHAGEANPSHVPVGVRHRNSVLPVSLRCNFKEVFISRTTERERRSSCEDTVPAAYV